MCMHANWCLFDVQITQPSALITLLLYMDSFLLVDDKKGENDHKLRMEMCLYYKCNIYRFMGENKNYMNV